MRACLAGAARRRAVALFCTALLLAQAPGLRAQGDTPAPLPLLDVPFISQSEALCGGAAAAMVLRYWGEHGVSAESFAHLVDRSAAGIRTGALVTDLRARGWNATAVKGREDLVRAELSRGRPVLTLVEDRPAAFHYLVIVAWHARGVVFHDPARAPFRVMGKAEFEKRWRAADWWMAIVLPGTDKKPGLIFEGAGDKSNRVSLIEGGTTCDLLIADGVRHAQSNDLDSAERVLTSVLDCPGPAAARELAGVRLLQRRWTEVAELAAAAVAADTRDVHAWKLLATSRFVRDDRLGALDAWNRAGEPRLDLVRVDGLTRTRHRIVEQLFGIETGEMLSVGRFVRLRRQLAELPSASSTRLDYAPVPLGLAELRGVVAERPLFPKDRLTLLMLGLTTPVTREVRIATGSLTGGGERVSGAWRIWPNRPRIAVGIRVPAPWGGLWSAEGVTEKQSFTSPLVPSTERAGAQVGVSDWATGRLRWDVAAGMDRWKDRATLASVGGGARFASFADGIDSRIGVSAWVGEGPFGTVHASVRARSSTEPRDVVLLATGVVAGATDGTPLDLWFAGDTGHARATLMRAHPVLDDGRLRVDRLGRTLVNASVEAQRWWRVRGAVLLGAAAFADVARTSRRLQGPAATGVDVGLGARVAVAGMPGAFRLDLAKGLRDGATALSFVYEP